MSARKDIEEIHEHHGCGFPLHEKFPFKLAQKGIHYPSPIDLSLKGMKPVHTAQALRWSSFFEPPFKLALKNSGDTVMVQGRWPGQRPTLSGDPLEGTYVFSQVHFHWESSEHNGNKHTIEGKSQPLEMHALFFKSCYKTEAEAREKSDGILIIVYFFKVGNHSNLKWMTDRLENVRTSQAATSLPPAPLCALMTPFKDNYIAYSGALSCSCHNVFWLVSCVPLRITRHELDQFCNVHTSCKEGTYKHIQTAKNEELKPVYRVNPTFQQLLSPDAADPACRIITGQGKITVITTFAHGTAFRETRDNGNFSHRGYCKAKPKPEDKLANNACGNEASNSGRSPAKLQGNRMPHERNTIMNGDQKLCLNNGSKRPAARAVLLNIFRHKFPGKKSIFISKRNSLEKERREYAEMISLMKKEREKIRVLKEFLDKEKRDSANEKKCLEEERGLVLLLREMLEKNLATIKDLKERLTKDMVGTDGNKVNTDQKQLNSPNHKDVTLTESKAVLGKQYRTQARTNIKGATIKPSLTEAADQTKTTSNPKLKKGEGNEALQQSKSKLPVTKKAFKPTGLQSSLTQYFQSPKDKVTVEKKPTSADDIRRTTVPKLNKGVIKRNTTRQLQDLHGKGDLAHHDP